MLNITSLKTEFGENPLGLDEREPRFSWILSADGRDVVQTRYRLRVSGGGTEWDSGERESARSHLVPYEGAPLLPRTIYRVRVDVRDNRGEAASSEGSFETGLFGAFSADWITDGRGSLDEGCPIFVKRFSLRERPVRARLYASALGVYVASLNGKRASDAVLPPGWTNYRKRVEYQTYDVTPLLSLDNELRIVLGPGWYRGRVGYWQGKNRDHYGEKGAVLCELHLDFADGTSLAVRSDASWQWTTGAIRTGELYDGETVDLTRGVDPLSPVSVLGAPKDVLVSQECPPVRVVRELPARRLFVTPKGETVIDFGQNFAGYVRARLRGKRGSSAVLSYAETLDRDGNFYTTNLRSAKARDVVILSGGEDGFEPSFTYHGFRYLRVEGAEHISAEDFVGCVCQSDLPLTGGFSCSHAGLNRLQENIVWGQRSNFFDIPTDCPQRDERLGWTGDAQMFFATAAFNMDVARFFGKWMRSVRDEQSAERGVPFVVPDIYEIRSSGAAAWGDCATVIPMGLFLSYGDERLLGEQYPVMRDWVGYIRSHENGRGLWQSGFQFGDWLSLDGGDRPDLNICVGATDVYLIANAFYAHSVSLTARAAEILGKREEAEELYKLRGRIEENFRKEYVTPNGRLVSDTQTAAVLALHFRLLEEKDRPRAAEELAENLHRHRDHLTTGFAGTPYLLHALSENGMGALAGKLLLTEDYPSWLYEVGMGATTVWERWNSMNPDRSIDDTGMNSFNHYSYGSVGEWMYTRLCGVNAAAPGYAESLLRPEPIEGLDFAEAWHETPYGRLSCRWERSDGGFTVRAEIPVNTRAAVILPKSRRRIEVGSGVYLFQDP